MLREFVEDDDDEEEEEEEEVEEEEVVVVAGVRRRLLLVPLSKSMDDLQSKKPSVKDNERTEGDCKTETWPNKTTTTSPKTKV